MGDRDHFARLIEAAQTHPITHLGPELGWGGFGRLDLTGNLVEGFGGLLGFAGSRAPLLQATNNRGDLSPSGFDCCQQDLVLPLNQVTLFGRHGRGAFSHIILEPFELGL